MKAKVLFGSFLIFLLLLITGCSQSTSKSLSFQQQIQDIMKQNNFDTNTVLDYEVKDNYIYVLSINGGIGNPLNLAIIKKDNNKLTWVAGHKSISGPMASISDKGSPIITIIEPRETNIESVMVSGKPIKSVSYYNSVSSNSVIETKYWITFSKQPLSTNDIKYIKD